ncbi:MAG: secretin N-terminal domain-containing protein [Candidatus Omnitrophota bacterium]
MKNNNIVGFFVSISVFVFFSSLFLPHLNAYTESIESVLYDPEATISMDLKDSSLKDILKVFSIQSGLNFIASEAVQDRSITLYMDKVPLGEAMAKIFKANNLSYDLDKDSNIFIVKDWGKTTIETLTRVFYLKHATVSSSPLEKDVTDYLAAAAETTTSSTSSSDSGSSEEEESGITKVIRKLLSEIGNVIEDPRTNSLIVTDTPNRMEVIAEVIASLDIPQPQVMLEVEMLDVDKNTVDKLGLNWANAGSFAMTIVSAARMTGFPISGISKFGDAVSKVTSDYTVGGDSSKYNAGEINFPGNLRWVFDFLRTQTDTKILARPRLMTLSNQTAEINITTNESIGTVQSVAGGGTAAVTTSTTEAERSMTGVSLRVTPQVNGESGEITMFLFPSVKNAVTSSTFAGGTSTGGTALPTYKDPAERTTKQVVRIKDGETVILGGLIRREISETINKIPLLGDIPLLGNFFRHKYKDKDSERELLVFITPYIVKEAGMKLAQAGLSVGGAALPEREQAAALGGNRDSLINSSLKRFENKK